ncbi:MAG: hypothetical protein ABW168_07795 [Sedimenticola sp.]
MKNSIKTVVSLTSAILFSSATFAAEDRNELDTDMLYGNSPVKASLGQPFVYTGPVREELSSGLVYNSGSETSHKFVPWDGKVSRNELDTDMFYGS